MRRVFSKFLDRTVKRRSAGAYWLYVVASKVVAAYENSDVDISRNGEAWLQGVIAKAGNVVVFDVGANVGEWTQSMLTAGADVCIVCYEPVPETYARLVESVDDPRAILVNAALSDAPGTLVIHTVPSRPDLSSAHVDHGAAFEVETLKLRKSTGDAEMTRLGIDRVTLLKIDCEGHDLAVLRGFRETLDDERVDFIQFEYNHTTLEAGASLKAFFITLGDRYVICRLLPSGLEVCAYHPALENFAQSNWVAVRLGVLDEQMRQRLALRPAAGIVGFTLRRELACQPERASQIGLTHWCTK